MKNLKSSVSTVAGIAVVLGMVACGGESRQQSANAPVGVSTESAQATPTELSSEHGSAMGQPGTTAGSETTSPSTTGASGQLNPPQQYGQTGQQGQYGQSTMGEQPSQYGQPSGQPPSGGMTPPAGTTGSTSAMGGAMDVSSLSDAQLAAVIEALHQGEMQEAQLAEQKATSTEVKRLARDMLNSHRNLLNMDQSVLSQAQITPSDNAVSQNLRTESQTEMSTLEGMRGRDFDREYVDDQIKAHNKAIELIDRIIPNIKNPQLKAQLQNARPKLEAHLREAERLQQKLQQGNANPQAPSRGTQGGTQSPPY